MQTVRERDSLCLKVFKWLNGTERRQAIDCDGSMNLIFSPLADVDGTVNEMMIGKKILFSK